MAKENEIEFDAKCKVLLKPLESAEELQNWIFVFLDLFFPKGTVYPDSTHGPADAMWRIYELMKTGDNIDIPQVCMLASRDSFKTLGAAALEVLCLLHFRISIAHMAAISSQSDKAIQYVNAFFRKLKPYLEHNGWKQNSDNKKMIGWITDEGQEVYIRIVIATIAGANCIDPDTIIITKDGKKKASEIKVGDYIKTYDFWKDEDLFVKVMSAGSITSDARKITFDDGSDLITSIKHKVFTQKGWLNTGNLKIGDKLIGNGVFHKTPEKESITEHCLKWNLNSMVFGTLLGDASIQKLPSGSCRYQVFHCKEQLDYLEKIKQTFEENNIKASIIKDKEGYRLYTEVNDFFKNVYRLCYINDKKTPSITWLSNVDLEALSFLIMDDGTTHRKEVGKYKESPISIAVMDFKNEQIDLIINRIKKLGYDCFRHKSGKYSQIRIPIKESRDLSLDIVDYFLDSLKYKLCFSDDLRFNIDTGVLSGSKFSYGFCWENKKTSNNKKGRDFREHIKNKLNKKIIKIENTGRHALTGIGIDPALNFNIKSFYANGNLVHNSEHVPMLFIDEVDVVQDPRALKEAQMIPSTFGNYYPLTIYLSTRKFAGGLMEKTLKKTINAGGEILRWNILDVTERIPHEKAKVDEPKKVRYVTRDLPMNTLMEKEWKGLPDEAKHKYERIEAYAGIADHPMLPIMRNYLVERPQSDYGGLYKKLTATHNNFKTLDADMADAQLLCNKPSASGLVYPRFDVVENVLSVQEAWERISGEDRPCDFTMLKQYLLDLGILFIGGGDWGFSHYTVLPVLAILPNGDIWHVETFMMQHLEIDDIVKYGKELQEAWNVDKWYCDQNYPSYLKTLRRKAGMKCPKFTKDVAAGISALQSKIVDSTNVRKYFVIDTPNNKPVITAYGEYRWATDAKGEVIEGKPFHDSEGVADIMDSIRYPFQNLFNKGAKASFGVAGQELQDKQKQLVTNSKDLKEMAEKVNKDMMMNKISSLSNTRQSDKRRNKSKKKILW